MERVITIHSEVIRIIPHSDERQFFFLFKRMLNINVIYVQGNPNGNIYISIEKGSYLLVLCSALSQ